MLPILDFPVNILKCQRFFHSVMLAFGQAQLNKPCSPFPSGFCQKTLISTYLEAKKLFYLLVMSGTTSE